MNFEGIKDDVKTMIAGGHIDVDVDKFLNWRTIVSRWLLPIRYSCGSATSTASAWNMSSKPARFFR